MLSAVVVTGALRVKGCEILIMEKVCLASLPSLNVTEFFNPKQDLTYSKLNFEDLTVLFCNP